MNIFREAWDAFTHADARKLIEQEQREQALSRVIKAAKEGGSHKEKLPGGGQVRAQRHPIGRNDGVAYTVEDKDGRIESRWLKR